MPTSSLDDPVPLDVMVAPDQYTGSTTELQRDTPPGSPPTL
ncbi:hypothetical protein ACH4Y0_02985 [Streptomyces sp. NPDC020707]